MQQQKTIHSHKDLIVWQKAIDLCKVVYKITETFPQREMYGLSSQLRRAAVSIPSNIAEGSSRSKKDNRRFLDIARGSCFEVVAILNVAARLGLITLD